MVLCTALVMGQGFVHTGGLAQRVTAYGSTAVESETEYVKGDSDLNGIVELKDAQIALKEVGMIVELTEEARNVTDADNSGDVDLNDVQLILKKALRITNDFPDYGYEEVDIDIVNDSVAAVVYNEETDTMTFQTPKRPRGVEMNNPFAGKTELVETIEEALKGQEIFPYLVEDILGNTISGGSVEYGGCDIYSCQVQRGNFYDVYYGPVDKYGNEMDPPTCVQVSEDGAMVTDHVLSEEEVQELYGDQVTTYQRPQWNEGGSISFWAKPVEADDSPLVTFKSANGIIILSVRGDIVFYSLDRDDWRGESIGGTMIPFNTFSALADEDMVKVNEWNYYTITFANDWIQVYINGKEMVYDKVNLNRQYTKCFNSGYLTRHNTVGIWTTDKLKKEGDPTGKTLEGEARNYLTKSGYLWELNAPVDENGYGPLDPFKGYNIGNDSASIRMNRIYEDPFGRDSQTLMEFLTNEKTRMYFGGISSIISLREQYQFFDLRVEPDTSTDLVQYQPEYVDVEVKDPTTGAVSIERLKATAALCKYFYSDHTLDEGTQVSNMTGYMSELTAKQVKSCYEKALQEKNFGKTEDALTQAVPTITAEAVSGKVIATISAKGNFEKFDFGVTYDSEALQVESIDWNANFESDCIDWGFVTSGDRTQQEYVTLLGVNAEATEYDGEVATITFAPKEGVETADGLQIFRDAGKIMRASKAATLAEAGAMPDGKTGIIKIEATEEGDVGDKETTTEQIPNEDGTVTDKVTEKETGEDGTITEKVTETTIGNDGTLTEKVTETITKPDGELITILKQLLQIAQDIYERLTTIEKELTDGSKSIKEITEESKKGADGVIEKVSKVIDEKVNKDGISTEKFEYSTKALPQEVEWAITQVDTLDDNDKDAIEKQCHGEYETYDIVPSIDGNKVDVSEGSVKVTLRCGSKWKDKDVQVYDFEKNRWLDADAEGEYVTFQVEHFSQYAIAEVVNVTLGDVDSNGDIELNDAQTALRLALLLIDKPIATETKAADVDENGVVELKDAQQILRKALLLIEEFEKAK